MHETTGMRCRQSTCELDTDVHDIAYRQRAPLQTVPKRLTLDELGDEVRTVIDLAEIVYDEDMGMVEAGRGSDFVMKPSEPIFAILEPLISLAVISCDSSIALGGFRRNQPCLLNRRTLIVRDPVLLCAHHS